MSDGNGEEVASEDLLPLDKSPDPEKEAREFETPEERKRHLHNENLAQDIIERRKYSQRSFNLTCVWVGFIIMSTVAQFVLNAIHRGIDRYQFITLITTTTGSVFGFWLIVGRYLFRSIPEDGPAAASSSGRERRRRS